MDSNTGLGGGKTPKGGAGTYSGDGGVSVNVAIRP
jgi:hypothetical protein